MKKTTMEERAKEIIKRLNRSKYYYMHNIEACEYVINRLKADSDTSTCPFPMYKIDGSEICRACGYFYLGTKEPACGCRLIKAGLITKHQALIGLHKFKKIMEEHIKSIKE